MALLKKKKTSFSVSSTTIEALWLSVHYYSVSLLLQATMGRLEESWLKLRFTGFCNVSSVIYDHPDIWKNINDLRKLTFLSCSACDEQKLVF